MVPFDKSVFAAKVRGKRAERRMSQEELAAKAGVSSDAIVKYESGKGYTPGADKVLALAVALECDPNELLGWPSQ